MDPQYFYEEFVVGNQCEFHEHRDSIRHAFNAAVAASHMADHYFYYENAHNPDPRFKTKEDLFDYVDRETNPASAHIRSISNAYKHLYTRGYYSDVSSAGAVVSITIDPPEDEVRELFAEGGDWDRSVHYRTTDEKTHDFSKTLDQVVTFWETFFVNAEN